MNFIKYADRDLLAIDVANIIAGKLKATLLHEDYATLAVPGGTTPGRIFDALCAATLDWDRVFVLPTDERCVPPDHERSNARLIRERLLVNRAAAATFLPLYPGSGEPEDSLAEVEAMLTPRLPLSVLILGMGEDMHTASLFPGMEGLEAALAADSPVLAVARPETQPEPRVTLTGPVLNGAMSKHLILKGPEKRAALERALSMPPEEAPIAAVLDQISVHWAE
ncbi:6-phosphogluconolactonase [Lutimaribacter marinistellae]|uniref:6-phosphogluconolactonase n=1 Tax=Lutimaribacter marinistellae TaxID=1820329 RepID=A0ABV7TIY6_9RHOB